MKVAVRVRPQKNSEVNSSEVKFEGKSNLPSILHVTDDGALIFDPIEAKQSFYYHGKKQSHRDISIVNKNLSFKFDDVFDGNAQNRDLFEKLMKPLVHALMDGSNCSFISYGASGTGKSHTVLGNGAQRGIAYLTMEYIFFQLNKRVSNEWIYEVNVSYVEVYNEKVINLLAKSKPLPPAQRANAGSNMAGLSMRKVASLTEVQRLLAMGNRNRTKHLSKMTHSSQSNTIFQVHINAPNSKSLPVSGPDDTVKLLIVELGGSERNTAEGMRPNSSEIANICKPILTFKNCLHRLADGSKNVPFNDSQLTKILKNSFSNNCQTVMLFNVSASTMNYTDTHNTLTYANKAIQIGKLSEKQGVVAGNESTQPRLKRNASYTISTSKPVSSKSIYTETVNQIKSTNINDVHTQNELTQKSDNGTVDNTELTELTRWYYEIGTIYDCVKQAVEGYCTSVSKEKLLELRLRCREYVEKCCALLSSGGSSRMARVRVKSLLAEMTKQSNIVPNKVNYWKCRLQICQQQLHNLHRKIRELKESNLNHILESYISMKEFEVNATKAHHESLHIMKMNAIYVNKTEIFGYLSVLGAYFEGPMCDETRNDRQSSGLNEIAEIELPLYKNCLADSRSKTNSKTKCNKVDSRTSMNMMAAKF